MTTLEILVRDINGVTLSADHKALTMTVADGSIIELKNPGREATYQIKRGDIEETEQFLRNIIDNDRIEIVKARSTSVGLNKLQNDFDRRYALADPGSSTRLRLFLELVQKNPRR